MLALARIIGIWVLGSSFITFTAMNVDTVDTPVAVPAQFPAPGNPGFPSPAPPKPMPDFSGTAGTGNASGGTGSTQGGVPSGGTGGESGSGIHERP